MSISSSTRKAGPYSCNGSTVAFPFAFKVFTQADVRVVLTDASGAESDLVLGTNYTVALNTDQDANPGGTVTTTATYATGYKVTLTSQVQNLQPVTLTNQGGFYPKIINDALDRLTIMAQQLSEQVGRAVKVGISSSSTPDALIASINTAASSAASSASSASSSASTAATQASNAATQAGNAASSAAAAAASAASINPATLAAKASVQTQDYTRFTAGGTADAITGTLNPAITSYVAGLRVTTTPLGANTLTAPTINLNSLGVKTVKKKDTSGAKVALAAGDYNASGPFNFEYDGTDFVLLDPLTQAATNKLTSVSASVAANALTVGLNPASLDFRSATLTNGVPNTRTVGSALSLTVPSGATLGTIAGQSARLVLIAIDNAGVVELAITNLSGGVNLAENTLINTTAISATANSANAVYSTTARTNVPFRVVGYLDIVEASAGVWASAPTLVQGAGGLSNLSVASTGAWQNVAASRALSTVYYNNTGKTMQVSVSMSTSTTATASAQVTQNGNTVIFSGSSTAGALNAAIYFDVPPGASYYVYPSAGTSTISTWIERSV